jgi:DNA-binding CsgD family transcriptional regulator/tetratricopeptide (TPR) repeat protein
MAIPPLPPALRLAPAFPFVGRAPELETLRALLPDAERPGRGLALVTGEAGSGKTRLVRELGREASEGGALVLCGTCGEAVRAPNRPFVECLEHLLRATDPRELRADLGPLGGELARLVPDIAQWAGPLRAPLRGEPDSERHRLHSAVTDLLTRTSERRPLIVVLEDLHWADGASLLCLRHLARGAADARMLVVVTYRDAEPGAAPEFLEALADLQRAEGVARVRLSGFSEGEVADFVRGAAGGEPIADAGDVAGALRDLTGGNPFLLGEVWRALVEDGALVPDDGGGLRLTRPLTEVASPRSVRDVVGDRVRRLSPEATELLELAAVAGPDVDLATLRRAAALDEAGVLRAIEELERSGVLEELHGRPLEYRFSHELVRRAVQDRLTGSRRAELHLRVGRALEEVAGDDPRRLASLAHHLRAAAPLGVADAAVEYTMRAARLAMTALAYDEAAALLRAALELGAMEPRARGEAHLALGTAGHRGGRTADALEGFRAAAAIADEEADADLFARAAIGFEEAWWRPGFVQRDAIDLLEEAARRLAGGDAPLRVVVLAGLSRALARIGEYERAAALRAEALGMARRLGEPGPLGAVLAGAFWHLPTSGARVVLAELAEARGLAERIDDAVLVTEAMAWQVPALVAVGELAAAGREVARLREVAAATRQPFKLHVAEHSGAAIALCEGRLADAEEMAARSREWSFHLTGSDAAGVYGIQMFSVRREQGRLRELEPVLRQTLGPGRLLGPWRPGLAALLAELGLEAETRDALRAVEARGLDTLRESLWVASLSYLADACAAIGDAAMAALVFPEMEPLAGAPIAIGHLVACYGAADRYLGMLAAVLGEHGTAQRHFEAALELERRMSARTWLAHTTYEYGRMLLSAPGSGPDERARAAGLLSEADALAESIGMPVLLARIRALPRARHAVSPLPDGLSGREAQIVGLIARGLSNREIGGALSISQHTAANHVRAILRKTRCANRAEVAAYAVQHGLLPAEDPD